jgi:hypothetical protein
MLRFWDLEIISIRAPNQSHPNQFLLLPHLCKLLSRQHSHQRVPLHAPRLSLSHRGLVATRRASSRSGAARQNNIPA